MITTTNMSLVAWDQTTDDYSHAALANNFIKIDQHDHTTTKGLQIPTGGLADLAVTSAKLASAGVTTTKLADQSVTNAKLAVGPKPLFLGAVAAFWRPNTSTPLPSASNSIWRVADGSTLLDEEHDFPGATTITLPDLRNHFILGATATGGGQDVNTSPAIGQTGGGHTKDLSHTHVLDGRSYHRNFFDDRDFDELGDILVRNRDFTGWPWSFWWWGYNVALKTDTKGSTAQDIRPSYVGLLLVVQVKEA